MDDVKSVVCHTAMMKSCIIWMRAGVITIDMHQIRPCKIMQTQSCRSRIPGERKCRKGCWQSEYILWQRKNPACKNQEAFKTWDTLGDHYYSCSSCTTGWRSGWCHKRSIQSEVENSSEIQTDTAETTDPGTYFYSWDDEQGYKDYSIGAGYGPAQAGVQFEAGKYGVFTSSAEVTLTVTRKKADNEQYTLKDGEDTLFLTFEEGDTNSGRIRREWLWQCLSDGVGRLKILV